MPPLSSQATNVPSIESVYVDKRLATALEKIPPQLRTEKARFVKVKPGEKDAFEQGWPKEANYSYNDPELLQHIANGGNYGFLCGSDDIINVDIDMVEELEDLGIIGRFEDEAAVTFSTSSGSTRGSFGLFYRCPEISRKIPAFHPTKKVTSQDGREVPLVEVLATGQQVVCPGSLHPGGTLYRTENNNKIETVSKQKIEELLQGLRFSSGNGKRKQQLVAQDQPRRQPITDINKLIAKFREYLYVEENYTILAPVCATLCNFCPGDPDIFGILGASGSLKTEVIRSFGTNVNEYTYPLSSITAKTLVSGKPGVEGVAEKLQHRVLVIKDLSTMLEKQKDERAQIFAQFRELIDGYIRFEYGNGEIKQVDDIHSSILFASTKTIERYYSMTASLGQRMLFFKPESDPKQAMIQAKKNSGKKVIMRKELNTAMMGYLDHWVPVMQEDERATTPEEIDERMGSLCMFLALARTPIHHNYHGVMDDVPEPEFPTRIASSIKRMIEVHAMINGRTEANEDDAAFGIRIIMDSIPTKRLHILNVLRIDKQKTNEIALKANLPTDTAKIILDELHALNLVHKQIPGQGEEWTDHKTGGYSLHTDTKAALERFPSSAGSWRRKPP